MAEPQTVKDWNATAADFLRGLPQEKANVSDDEDEADRTTEDAPSMPNADDIDRYIGVFRTYELRQGINRQPILEYYDDDASGTFNGRNAREGDGGQIYGSKRRSRQRRTNRIFRPQNSEPAGIEDDADDEVEGKFVERRSGLIHPIAFFVNPKECHWCNNVGYGIIAPGPTTTIKVDVTNGDSCLEWTPHHSKCHSHGLSASRMCAEHARLRLKIALCQKHCLNSIDPGAEATNRTLKDDAEHLTNALQRLKNGYIRPTDHFCNLCLNMATYHCVPNESHTHTPEAGTSMTGPLLGRTCGLKVCNLCMAVMNSRMRKEPDSCCDVQRHLRWLFVTKDNPLYNFGPRSDAELLLSDGLLVKNYRVLIQRCSSLER